MERIYHPYTTWEEIGANMWGDISDRDDALVRAIEFTGNHELYGSFMLRVIIEWPISCENALSDMFINRRAWVGHAAVAMALSIPEYITRKAWGYLTNEQRYLANKEADRAIRKWEFNFNNGKIISQNMGTKMLF